VHRTYKLGVAIEHDNTVVVHLVIESLQKLLDVGLEDGFQVVLGYRDDIVAGLFPVKRPENALLNHGCLIMVRRILI
jgi:hypothetical protein